MPRKRTDSPEDRWQEFLDAIGRNMLIDSNLGRSAFAWGAAMVIERLQTDWSKAQLDRTLEDFRNFTQAYMASTPPTP